MKDFEIFVYIAFVANRAFVFHKHILFHLVEHIIFAPSFNYFPRDTPKAWGLGESSSLLSVVMIHIESFCSYTRFI